MEARVGLANRGCIESHRGRPARNSCAFISGRRSFKPTRAQQEKLRSYVEQGGFIFAEACNQDGCDGAQFEADFKKFVVDTFEKPLEKISPDHPIWNVEARVDPKFLPHDFWLYGVQTCCRMGVVYSPISLSCRWELNAPFGIKAARSPKLQAELDNATKVGVNVLSFATGKQLKEKLDAVSILEGDLPTQPGDRATLVIPKLEHGAGLTMRLGLCPISCCGWIARTHFKSATNIG